MANRQIENACDGSGQPDPEIGPADEYGVCPVCSWWGPVRQPGAFIKRHPAAVAMPMEASR